MTIQLHMDSHEGTYTKSFNAKVEATFPGIVELDKTAFYHLGGGQPADKGVILWKGNQAQVIDVKKKNRIRHFVEGDLPEIGEIVEGKISIDEIIKINNIEIGKIINNSNFPFALFKFKDPNFKLEEILNTDKAKIKAKKPFWS